MPDRNLKRDLKEFIELNDSLITKVQRLEENETYQDDIIDELMNVLGEIANIHNYKDVATPDGPVKVWTRTESIQKYARDAISEV